MKHQGLPSLGTCLAIDGVPSIEAMDVIRNGSHIIVSTPFRMMDMLYKKMIKLDMCRYFCMDEADRMIDMGFEEDVRTIFSSFSGKRQTLLSSTTILKTFHNCARSAMVRPVTVNEGRAGAAMNFMLEVEFIQPRLKFVE